MKRLVIDTNVILDALLPDRERPQGDRNNALMILEAVARRNVVGLLSPVVFSELVHVAKPRRTDRAAVARALAFLLDICEWTPITADTYRMALDSTFHDVNDAVIFFAAGSPSAIVTRNTKDFRDHVNVEVMTAAEFVRKHLKRTP
jgi:predicted nucleic acid-binding protein